MLNKATVYTIGALILIIIGQFFYNDIANAKREKELLDQRNKIAEMSSIVKEDSSKFSRLVQETSSQKDINAFLTKENVTLRDKIKKIQSTVVVVVKPDTVKFNSKNLAVGDSISQIVDTTKTPERVEVAFLLGKNDPLYSILGHTLTNPPEAEVNVLQKPFKAFYILNQNEDYTWKATVGFQTLDDKPMPFEVTSINGRINPRPVAEASKYNLGLGGSVSMYKLAPGVLIKMCANVITFDYKIIDQLSNNDSKKWYDRLEFGYYRLLTY